MGILYGMHKKGPHNSAAGSSASTRVNADGPAFGTGSRMEGSIFPPATTAVRPDASFVYGEVGDSEHMLPRAKFPIPDWLRPSSYAGDDSPARVFGMGGSAISEYRMRYQVALNRLRPVNMQVPMIRDMPPAVALRLPLDKIPLGTTRRLKIGGNTTKWPQATMVWPTLGGND